MSHYYDQFITSADKPPRQSSRLKTAITIEPNELQRLIDLYCAEKAVDSTDGLRRLFLKGFMEWLRERETETD